ncbi:MAG: IS1634 family transposase, partial [Candidatus Cloacimonadaceae bacterium]|nr:IS1634 family transposase [Candidatus Cloacimonadaceae bacterium]
MTKTNKGSGKQYDEYRLVKSCRNGDKVSQTIILVMQEIRVPQQQWKALATAIEALINGQEVLFREQAIQAEAERWVSAYLSKKSRDTMPLEINPKDDEDYESVSISSISNRQPKSIGAEHISLSIYRELGFEGIFQELGFTGKQRNDAALSILGKMLEPGSENATAGWSRIHTGLGELLGADFSRLSHNALYRITDQIYKYKEHIERKLRENECSIFDLKESIFLYDLTNTYLEGMARGISKARFGFSKEKRSDCRLLTLGLVLDDLCFPKRSRVMEGSVSESATLGKMIEYLSDEDDWKAVTVVIDAGIATEANLAYLRKKKYHYVCVARNKPIPETQIDKAEFVPVSNKGGNQIHAQVFKKENECVLYCESEKMGLKEKAMQEKFCSRFEAELNKLRDALAAKKGKRNFEYIQDRVSRLKERFKSVSSFYTIDISREDDKAGSLQYACDRQGALDTKYSGSYFLRTCHMDLSSDKIWSIYMMLNTVESAFRTLKSELHFRPVYHQKESRAEAHLFVAVLAYHVVNAIHHRLQEHKITISWNTLRKMMRNHQLILTTMQTRKGTTITILDTTVAEDNHKQIYNALNLSHNP